MSLKKGMVEQADVHTLRPNSARQFTKLKKRRAERRKAKGDPEAQPTYGKYGGYMS
jgi:hypothetical protein